MKNRKRIVALLIAVALFACATFVKAILNSFSGVPDISPCRPPEDAKRRGTWVCDVAIIPAQLKWQGHDIGFREAWVEEAAAPDHFLVWFPYYRRIGWHYLCFRLANGRELFPGVVGRPFPWFGLEGEHNGFAISFTHEQPGTFFTWFDAPYSFPMHMGIAPTPLEPVVSYEITLTVTPKG